jgi:flagellin-like hook-associated protein FlgL
VSSDLSDTLQRLSSGQRINRASDDAAGLSVSSSLTTKSRIYAQGMRNVNDGISMISIAEGALSNLQDIVTRVSELAEQAATGTFSGKQRVALDREADALLKEYNRIIQGTSFNGTAILDGSDDTVRLQHGLGVAQSTSVAIGAELGDRAGSGTLVPQAASHDVGDADLFVADFNRDGKADIASPGRVALGNGDGTFQASSSFSAAASAVSVTGADFNGDGKIDLVTGETSASFVSVALGNGNGTFSSRTTFAVTDAVYSLITADFNNDGNIDIAGANLFSGHVSVLIGNGDGSFRAQRTFQAGSAPRDLIAVDVNGDGQTDIVVANSGDSSLSVLAGRGDGTFGTATSVSVGGSQPVSVAATDFNGDDKVDLAVTSGFGSARVWMGNGNGSFSGGALLDVAGDNAAGSVVGDFNGDGLMDVSAYDTDRVQLNTWLGNGNGSFGAASVVDDPMGAIGGGLSLGDFNGDGAPATTLPGWLRRTPQPNKGRY